MIIMGYISEKELSDIRSGKLDEIMTFYTKPKLTSFHDGSEYFYEHNQKIEIIIPDKEGK